jgi:hypothetical protein
MILRHVGKYLPSDTALYPRILICDSDSFCHFRKEVTKIYLLYATFYVLFLRIKYIYITNCDDDTEIYIFVSPSRLRVTPLKPSKVKQQSYIVKVFKNLLKFAILFKIK